MSVYLSVCPSPTSLLNLHSAEGADVGHDATISCLGRRFVVSTHRSIHLFIYTVGHKKRDTFIFFDNLDKYWPIFVIFFTAIYNNNELRNKNLLKFLPHLKSVAAVPCETWNVKCVDIQQDHIQFKTDSKCQVTVLTYIFILFYIRRSKWPPFARTQAVSRARHWSIASSMTFCATHSTGADTARRRHLRVSRIS